MSSSPLRRLFLSLRARYHVWSGRRAYRLGRIRVAGRHFREALASGVESFEAYLLLGKIYFRENDLARAATCFTMARNSDPARFTSEGFPEDFIESLRERNDAAAAARRKGAGGRPEYRITIEVTSRDRPRRPEPAPRAKLGDFASRDEWLRHRDRPAIRPGEGGDVDWDSEARNLFGD
ncbi:MAG TPA: tetratricopeptide repeat protein [Planctomycetota bacterium]|nr:tetratricopeptide repeat protein [Planctomycetota bacterium]